MKSDHIALSFVGDTAGLEGKSQVQADLQVLQGRRSFSNGPWKKGRSVEVCYPFLFFSHEGWYVKCKMPIKSSLQPKSLSQQGPLVEDASSSLSCLPPGKEKWKGKDELCKQNKIENGKELRDQLSPAHM